MAVELPRTDLALEECRKHLEAVTASKSNLDTALIEAYLAQHLAVVLCAEVEEIVTGLVYDRIDRSGCDPEIISLLKARKRGVIRNASHKEIADTLGQLGVGVRDAYVNAIDNGIGERGIWHLGNAVAARDDVAHRAPPNVSLGDVRLAFEAATEVIAAVRLSLV